MNNLNNLLKQAQQMQSKLMEAQAKLAELEISGNSGGGMVNVIITGNGQAKRVFIDPSLMVPQDVDVVSDLIVAAFNDAKNKLEKKASEQMNMDSLLPPGMKLPF